MPFLAVTVGGTAVGNLTSGSITPLLSHAAAQLVRHVREEWSFGEGQAVERPATYY